jgi:general stress protein 26
MILNDLRNYLQQHRIAVLATVNDQGAPEAALVGVAVTDELDLVFDTLAATRKHANLRRCPRTAVVFSGPGECTVQYEGEASLLDPEAAASAPFLAAYYAAWPDGRARAAWPGLVYWRVRPRWARYADYASGPLIVEFDLSGA